MSGPTRCITMTTTEACHPHLYSLQQVMGMAAWQLLLSICLLLILSLLLFLLPVSICFRHRVSLCTQAGLEPTSASEVLGLPTVPPLHSCVSACCGAFAVMLGVFLKLGLCRVFFSLPKKPLSQVPPLINSFPVTPTLACQH